MADTEPNATDKPGTAARWHEALRKYQKTTDKWEERARKIVRLYKRQEGMDSGQRRFSMLWANTEVLKPATLARPPAPVVTRRFRDGDPQGRLASDILERVLSTTGEQGNDYDVYTLSRDDLLLVGRGICRARYDAETEPIVDPMTQQPMGERVVSEKAPLDFVPWGDFAHGPGRFWAEVQWVAFRAWLSEEDWKKRFGEKPFVAEGDKNEDTSSGKPMGKKAAVWEIWSRRDDRVFWVSLHQQDVLDEAEPHLRFDGFFPCPKPLYGTLAGSLIPTPDYVYYQDQAEEIDELTDRIGKLQVNLKLVGFYPGGSETTAQIEEALQPSVENRMIPVDSWAAFAEGGGQKGVVVWLPVDMVVEVIKGCIELRRQLVEDIYQITGISDIMRGETEASETLGAQQLKSQFGGMRIRDKQNDMARFCRDAIRLKAEVIAENFQPQTLAEMSGKPVEEVMQVMELLRSERLRGFRIDVETDSTILPDENEEKARRAELLTAVGGFFQQAMPVVQTFPQAAPLVGALLQFTVRGFRAGREIEEVIDQTVQQMTQAAQMATMQPPPPDPKAEAVKMKAEADMQQTQLKTQSAQAEHGMKMQSMTTKHAIDMEALKAKTIAAQMQPPPAPQRLQ